MEIREMPITFAPYRYHFLTNLKPFQGQMKGAPVIQLYISHIHFLNYVFVL